jgi:ketosteroid isomerase-like protein
MDIAQKRPIILPRMFASLSSRLYIIAMLAALVSLAPVSNVARAHEPDATEIALGSLVDAELAFARLSLERGIRAAFLANFADDGVVFEPAPMRLQAAWPTRPHAADPKALRLEWHPAQAGVARSGDMGFTTGPFTLTDTRRPGFVRHGAFFSIWQRDPKGVWRVSIDMGTTTPTAPDFVPLGAAPRPTYDGKADAALQRSALLKLESRRFDNGPAYAKLLAADARLYREGVLPVAGRAAVLAQVASHATHVEWLPFEVRIARTGDMAATYGEFQARGGTTGEQRGYYVHLWLRDAKGRWRLAYDITNG